MTGARCRILVALALAAAAGPCFAQVDAREEPLEAARRPQQPEPEYDTSVKLSFDGGYQYIFKTDVGDFGDGEVDIGRAGLALEIKKPFNPRFSIALNIRYLFDDYNFTGTVSPLGPAPWGDVHSLAFTLPVEWWLNRETAFILSPVIMFSREANADWNDGDMYGGYGGFMIVSNPRFIWGGGIGVLTQIEDDVLVYPILILEWQITDDLHLTSVGGPVGLASTGLELEWDLGGGWEVGFGGRYEFRRFRLDKAGTAPDGVGEDTSVPFWARVSYRFNENFVIDAYLGVITAGSLRIENSGGFELGSASYGPTPTAALAVRFTF